MFTVLDFSKSSITIVRPSNGLDLSDGHDREGKDEDESLPSVENLLLDTEGV